MEAACIKLRLKLPMHGLERSLHLPLVLHVCLVQLLLETLHASLQPHDVNGQTPARGARTDGPAPAACAPRPPAPRAPTHRRARTVASSSSCLGTRSAPSSGTARPGARASEAILLPSVSGRAARSLHLRPTPRPLKRVGGPRRISDSEFSFFEPTRHSRSQWGMLSKRAGLGGAGAAKPPCASGSPATSGSSAPRRSGASTVGWPRSRAWL